MSNNNFSFYVFQVSVLQITEVLDVKSNYRDDR